MSKDNDKLREIWRMQAAIAENLLKKIADSAPSAGQQVVKCLTGMQKRAMSALNSLTVLDQSNSHDYLHDGAVILRALYDVHLQALYLLQDPETRSRLFTDYLAVQVYELLRLADGNQADLGESIRSSLLRPYFVQNVMTNYTSVRSQFLTRKGDACRSYWYPGTLADLADAVGYHSEYEMIQRTLSNSVHSTPLALIFGATVNKPILLNRAWAFNLRMLGAMAEYIGIHLDEREEMLVKLSRHNLSDNPLPL